MDHANYAEYRMGDLALVKLSSPVDFGRWPGVRPACLPEQGQDKEGAAELLSVGWDTLRPGKIKQVRRRQSQIKRRRVSFLATRAWTGVLL